MTESEDVDFLESIEAQFPVEQWKINGRFVWPIIRGIIANYNRSMYIVERKAHLGIFTRIFREIRGMVKFPLYNIFSKSKKDTIVFHDNFDRTIKLKDGRYYDRNLDPIVDILHDSGISVLNIEQCRDGKRNMTYNVLQSIDMMLMFIRFYNKLFMQKGKICLPEYDKFLRYLPKKLQKRLDIQVLRHEVGLIDRISRMMKWIIVRHQVKMVILECWYDIYRYSWSVACTDLGVKCVDIQHGRAGGTGHDFYTGWTKFPLRNKYEMMPNIFWTWTQEDKDAIDNWHVGNVIAYCGGKPVNMVLDNISNMIDMSFCKTIKKELPIILVSLQWGVVYPEWFADFIRTSRQYIWLIRFHPIKEEMQKEFAKKISENENVVIENVDAILLEVLLQHIDLHVTSSSSTIVDAAMQGKPSIMINSKYKTSFLRYFDAGILKLATDAKTLEKDIKESLISKIEKYKDEPIGNHGEFLINIIKKTDYKESV